MVFDLQRVEGLSDESASSISPQKTPRPLDLRARHQDSWASTPDSSRRTPLGAALGPAPSPGPIGHVICRICEEQVPFLKWQDRVEPFFDCLGMMTLIEHAIGVLMTAASSTHSAQTFYVKIGNFTLLEMHGCHCASSI